MLDAMTELGRRDSRRRAEREMGCYGRRVTANGRALVLLEPAAQVLHVSGGRAVDGQTGAVLSGGSGIAGSTAQR